MEKRDNSIIFKNIILIYQISKRKTDKNLYIDSQAEYSDIIVRAFKIQDQEDEILDIGYEMFLPNSIYIEKIINTIF